MPQKTRLRLPILRQKRQQRQARRTVPRKPPRRLRQEIVLMLCTALIFILGGILVGPTLLSNPQKEIENMYIYQRMVNTSNISELLDQKNINLGESAKIKSLLRDSLPAGIFLSSFDITLNKLTITYDLTEVSGSTQESYDEFWTADNTEQIIMYNTAALFVLVRNLEIVEINVKGYSFPTCIFTAEQAADVFNLETLSQISTAVEWQQELIVNGVYDSETRAAFFAIYPLTRPAGPIA